MAIPLFFGFYYPYGTNRNIRIFMGTNDEKTRNAISEACGKHKIKSVSYNENKDMSVSTSAQSVPLIYPSELKNLNNPSNGVFGNAIVLVAETFPIKSTTTPYFKAMDIYGLEKGAEVPKKDFMFFDEEQNRYDVARLIYLHHCLDDEEEIISSDEAHSESRVEDIKEISKRKRAVLALEEQISEQIDKLKGKIPEDEYVLLGMASVYEKIQLLDALAEQATHDGNVFLVMDIEQVIGFLRHCLNNSFAENPQEEKLYD